MTYNIVKLTVVAVLIVVVIVGMGLGWIPDDLARFVLGLLVGWIVGDIARPHTGGPAIGRDT